MWKNLNFLHNNFLRFNNYLGKLYIVLNECLVTNRIQITLLLFHLIIINKFYEQNGSLIIGKKLSFLLIFRMDVGMTFNHENNL